MSFILKNRPKYLIAFFLVSLLSILSFLMYGNTEIKADLGATGDAVKYIEMSKHTFAQVDNPYALRILSPLIVKIFSGIFHTDINFPWILLTLVATILAIMVFFHILLKCFKLTFFNAILFTIVLAYTYSYSLFNYADFWLVDPLNNLFFALGFLFLIEKKYYHFLAILLIGFMNKEIILFLLPLYPLRVFLDSKSFPSKKFFISIVYSLVLVALFVLFRKVVSHLIDSGVQYSVFNATEGRSFTENIRFSISLVKNQLSVYTVFDFFWIFSLYSAYLIYKINGWKNWFFISFVYLFVVLFLSRFFATDVERVYVTMAPMVFLLVSILFANRNSNQDKKWLVAIAFVYIATNLNWISYEYFIISNVAVLAIFASVFKDIDDSFIKNKKIHESLR